MRMARNVSDRHVSTGWLPECIEIPDGLSNPTRADERSRDDLNGREAPTVPSALALKSKMYVFSHDFQNPQPDTNGTKTNLLKAEAAGDFCTESKRDGGEIPVDGTGGEEPSQGKKWARYSSINASYAD